VSSADYNAGEEGGGKANESISMAAEIGGAAATAAAASATAIASASKMRINRCPSPSGYAEFV